MQLSLDARRGVILCAMASIVLVIYFTRGVAGTNPASRYATMDALVHDGTFVVDQSVFAKTIDKIFRDGHFYSSKPPLLSTVGAGAYWVLNKVFGLSFRDGSRGMALLVMNLLLALGPHILLLIYFYRLLCLWTARADVVLWSYATVALGILGVGYATSLNNHTVAAAMLTVAFYYAFRVRSGQSQAPRHWLLAGLCAGIAPGIDLGAAFVSLAIGIYLLTYDWRRTLYLFGAASLVPMAAHFWLTYQVSGGFVPVYLRQEFYHYPGSYWNAPRGIDALREPKPIYFFNMILGHHGLLTMTPLIVLALIGLGVVVRRRTSRLPEALTVGAALVALVIFYTATTNNYGGVCVGFRWLIMVTPLVLLFITEFLSRFDKSRLASVLFICCLAIGQYHMVNALQTPWQTSWWHKQLDAIARG